MHQHRTTTSIAVAALVALGLAAPGWAADEGAADSGSAGSATDTRAEPVSDQQLEQFAVALTSMQQIRMEYAPKLRQAEDKAEQQRLKQQGRKEMIKAIRDSGLEVKEYNRIGNRIGTDSELKERVREIMQQQSG